MGKIKVALVGAGGISQVVRIPSLKNFEDVELVALCDADESKVSFVAEKFRIDRVYFDIQNLIAKENPSQKGSPVDADFTSKCPVCHSAKLVSGTAISQHLLV